MGQKLDVTHKSSLGSGKKFVRWDWQIYYRDENDNVYNSIISDKEKPNIPAPTKPGEIMIFLNIADDYKLKGNPRHLNSSSHGNWRTEQIMDFNIPDNPDFQVKGWYFTGAKIKVEPEGKADMIMRELELIDPETGKTIESFKREVDPLDPFNSKKEKLIRTSTRPQDSSSLEKNKKYKVRAKYQFVSFEEGSFDISKPETMTVEQRNLSTEVIPNELDVHYSYDDNVLRDGVFDESMRIPSKDKPHIPLMNLEYATFEWEYEVPKEVKRYIKIAGVIPDTFAKKRKDDNPYNNWALVFGQIEPNDIGMHKNVD